MTQTTSIGERRTHASLRRNDVMARYTGVLRKVSGGTSVIRGGYGSGMVGREFIDIGDTHLRNVKLTAYHDELLLDAVGETVSLSVAGSMWGRGGPGTKTVVGIRTPRAGKKRVNALTLILAVITTILVLALSSLVIAFVAGIGYVAVYNLLDEKWHQPYVIAAAVLIAIPVLRGVVYAVRVFIAYTQSHSAPEAPREKVVA
jgi:hypothetical protein